MGSLANCLKKMGLGQHEAAILRGKFDELKGDGYEASLAAKEAVTEHLDELLRQRTEITQQATKDIPVERESNEEVGPPPPYGKPMSKQRTKFLIWDAKRVVSEKESKLEGLLGKKEETIKWDREWEADTRVHSFATAREEIRYFRGG